MLREIVAALLVIGGKQTLAKDIALHWGEMLPSDEMEAAQVAVLKKQVGFSDDTLIRELGGDPKLERERRTVNAQDVGDAMMKAFDAGAGGEPDTASQVDDIDSIAKQANAAGILIRSGFAPEAALKAVGLDPIKHLGLLPVTLQE